MNTKNETDHLNKNCLSQRIVATDSGDASANNANEVATNQGAAQESPARQIEHSDAFSKFDENEFVPEDFRVEVFTESIEASVGYSSLIRQLNEVYRERITFFMSPAGGSMSHEEARKAAFRKCEDTEEAQKIFDDLVRMPVDQFDFQSLGQLWDHAPRAAERLWQILKHEGRKEFESGHLAANAMFPAAYMKEAWNIAKYLGIRESFVAEWKPKGGIEVSLIDMLAQTFFQSQYWMEQVVLRSQTEPRREHEEYRKWKRWNERAKDAESWQDGYWFQPYVEEQQAIDHAVQMVDRWNRIYTRTLRQLRDLRRWSPVTINNAKQVNIATDGGQQINSSDIGG